MPAKDAAVMFACDPFGWFLYWRTTSDDDEQYCFAVAL
jgi:hypothetical protein